MRLRYGDNAKQVSRRDRGDAEKGKRSNLLAGWERHSASVTNAATTAILVEDSAQHSIGPTGKAWHHNHGLGGNILFLDGHVVPAKLDLPFFHDTRAYVENMF